MHGVTQGRGLGFGFAEKLILHACDILLIFFKREEVRKRAYMEVFGPGGDTSIPPVPLLKNTLATLGIPTQHSSASRNPSSGIFLN